MAIQKGELRAVPMDVGVNEVPLANRWCIFCIKQPDDRSWLSDRRDFHLNTVCPRAIYILIQAIVKQIVTVTRWGDIRTPLI